MGIGLLECYISYLAIDMYIYKESTIIRTGPFLRTF